MERLEVEDEQQRQDRIQNLLESLNAPSTSTRTNFEKLGVPSDSSEPHRVLHPPSDLLARVQSFLPQIEASNALLSRADPETLDIENVGEEEGSYIEMNLGLGVFEDRSKKNEKRAGTNSDVDIDSGSDDDSLECSDCDSSSDSSEGRCDGGSESDEEDIPMS